MAAVQLVVSAIQEATVRAGASRHVAAAVAAALSRVAVGTDLAFDDAEVNDEVRARIEPIERAVREKVRAGAKGESAKLSGGQRAWRNVAEHKDLGKGVEALPSSEAEAKRMQRGGSEKKAGKAACETTSRSKPLNKRRGGNFVEKQTPSQQGNGFDRDSTCLEGSAQMNASESKCVMELPTNE